MSKTTVTQIKSEIASASQDAVKLIAQAAKDASTLIAASATEARNVVSVNAADAARVLATTNSGDHDLLQRVDTKVDALIITVDKISTRDNLYVLKEDFFFWRNIIVVGMLLTIFTSVVTRYFIK
jgi:hypothetical protein